MDGHTFFPDMFDNPFDVLNEGLTNYYTSLKDFYEVDRIVAQEGGYINSPEIIINTLQAFYEYLIRLEDFLRSKFKIDFEDLMVLKKLYTFGGEEFEEYYNFDEKFEDKIFFNNIRVRLQKIHEVFEFLLGASESIMENTKTNLFTSILIRHQTRIYKNCLQILNPDIEIDEGGGGFPPDAYYRMIA